MRGTVDQFVASLRLHFRNRMALIYSYIFPTIFLLAFWILYRHDRVPLAQHLGELLTVTILGGACFGLPTSLVSERELGVWRRYRLTPVSTGSIVASTVAGRYVLLLIAGLLQIVLALLLGMPQPNHPVELWLAFTIVAFAFLGLGMVIAAMADTVPAVQALGQCIFLPMLILGGVAVPLASLPDWTQRLAMFFPGRYAVDLIQACTTGDGIAAAGFAATALLVMGACAFAAGAKLFRWDAQQRFAAIGGKGWVAAALVPWLAIGVLARPGAETPRRPTIPSVVRTVPETPAAGVVPAPVPTPTPAAPAPEPTPAPSEPVPSAAETPVPVTPPVATHESPAPAAAPAPTETSRAAASDTAGGRAAPSGAPRPASPAPGVASTPDTTDARSANNSTSPASNDTATPAETAPSGSTSAIPLREGLESWRDVTREDVDRDLVFDRLPPDTGIVAPIAPMDEDPGQELGITLDVVRSRLPTWPPARVADPVQRVRNILFVAAVPDVFQTPIERYLPIVVFERLRTDFTDEELMKILYWIALHPDDGDESAIDRLQELGLENGPGDTSEARQRVAYYAVKLLGRVVGKIQGK